MRPDPDAGPDPAGATNPADFVARLRALRQWSGLTFRQIERRAQANGDVLPHSTVSTALGRTTLPREELVTAFVRAAGCDKETVELWAATRRRLAMEAELAQSTTDPAPEAPPPTDDDDSSEWWPPPQEAVEEPIGTAYEPSTSPRAAGVLEKPTVEAEPVEAEPVVATHVAGEHVTVEDELPPLGIKPREYSAGTLATAVQKRRHQNTWVGLHRRTTGGDDERSRRFGFKDLVPPVVWRAGWSTRAMLGLLAIVLFAVVSGAIVRGIRDGILADPPGGEICCVDGDQDGDGFGDPPATPTPDPSSGTDPTASPAPAPTGTAPTTPIVNPKPTQSSPAAPRPSPTPTPNQPQNPKLTGSSSPSCVRRGEEWWLDIPVSASLSGASSGTGPTATAGPADSMQTFTLGGSGSTSFSGQTSVYVGQYSPVVTVMGNIQWSVTVSLPDNSKIGTSGRESYRCN